MVTINGEAAAGAAGMTIGAYLAQEGYDIARVVVEQNLNILPRQALETTVIQEGDSIEILCFVGGG